MTNMTLDQALKPLRNCVEYCRQQNGRDECKNCGLDDEMINNAIRSLLTEDIERLEKEKAIQKQLAQEWTGIDVIERITHKINPHIEKMEVFASEFSHKKQLLEEINK